MFSQSINHSPHATCAALRHARKSLCKRAASAAAANDGEFIEEFPSLVNAVETAFRREEVVMELLGFPKLSERREEHATVLAALHRVTPAVEAGNLALGHEVVDALCCVLDFHRLTSDLALALAADSREKPAHSRAHQNRNRVFVCCRMRRMARA